MLNRVNTLAILALLSMMSVRAVAQTGPTFPNIVDRVVDQAALLDPGVTQSLDAQLAAHEEQTSNQVIVVTVNSLEGYDIADYALRLGRSWGIGTEEKNNGVVLLVAPNERKVRIEVGYGLEGALPDGLAGQIIRRDILPQFKEDDYPGGITAGVASILQAVVGEYKAEPLSSRKPSKNRSANSRVFDIVPLIFIGMVGLPAILRRTGLFRLANAAFPAGFAGLAATLVLGKLLFGLLIGVAVFIALYFLNPKVDDSESGSVRRRTNRNHHRSGRTGGGGSGGGFSGGGGSFGGGGASGSW